MQGTKHYWLKLGGFKLNGHSTTGYFDVFTDSDHAGCMETRKNTSSAFITMNGYTVHHHARQQTTVATSSAEAEYYAMCSGVAEALGI